MLVLTSGYCSVFKFQMICSYPCLWVYLSAENFILSVTVTWCLPLFWAEGRSERNSSLPAALIKERNVSSVCFDSAASGSAPSLLKNAENVSTASLFCNIARQRDMKANVSHTHTQAAQHLMLTITTNPRVQRQNITQRVCRVVLVVAVVVILS